MAEICERVEKVRSKVKKRIGTGVFRGTEEEYLDTYDLQVDKVNKKLGSEKRYWSNQARQINMLKAKQESQLK